MVHDSHYDIDDMHQIRLIFDLSKVEIFLKISLILTSRNKSDSSIAVLAMDHRNDCVSNSVALICAWLANKYLIKLIKNFIYQFLQILLLLGSNRCSFRLILYPAHLGSNW